MLKRRSETYFCTAQYALKRETEAQGHRENRDTERNRHTERNRDTERQKHRTQRDRGTGTQRDRETGTQIDRGTGTQGHRHLAGLRRHIPLILGFQRVISWY